ncbi:NAD-dependent epimerase/dehydratase family protein [Chitinophaga sp. SYP-B3965]|uniref:NAD-dependent epimerase/dehydratase family protein n=1 Tax=Chitinophaga sp. SYP-B3965 TaxID=2663120 RepID=UPI001299B227|nr:NAD-dependent epimerase/dehydratase family protein [Chitinophaga sp. SYP-B3965]MRG47169.1 NAD-dependent epimerase/dehydratase family protein [Chitinophaga sp. SYP-B3965]
MQTILGAGGTIGQPLAKELAAYTNKIRLVSRKPVKVNEGDELFPADLTDRSQVFKAIEGSAIVYLVIGFPYSIKVWRKEWPALMRNVIDACKEYKAKLVFFDNVYMYDKTAIPHMTEESPINPPSKKGKVRAAILQMLMDEVKQQQLTAVIARAADFYGPGKGNTSVLNEVVYKNFLQGKKANWFASAEKKHTYTYGPDAAKGTALLGNTPDAFNQVWHLPTNPNALTGRQFIELFAKEMNVAPKFSALPQWMASAIGLFVPIMKELAEMFYQYDRDYIFDSSKFNKRFQFTPTTYEEGIRATVKG